MVKTLGVTLCLLLVQDCLHFVPSSFTHFFEESSLFARAGSLFCQTVSRWLCAPCTNFDLFFLHPRSLHKISVFWTFYDFLVLIFDIIHRLVVVFRAEGEGGVTAVQARPIARRSPRSPRPPTAWMYLSAHGGRKVPKERHQRAHALWKPVWPLCFCLTEHIHGGVSQYSLRKYLRRRTFRNAAKLNPKQMRGHSCRYLLSCAATQGRHASDALPAG